MLGALSTGPELSFAISESVTNSIDWLHGGMGQIGGPVILARTCLVANCLGLLLILPSLLLVTSHHYQVAA